jgi:alanine racemase
MTYQPAPSNKPAGSGECAGAVLTIDLDAVAENYQLLKERSAPAACGAVVKADAYGLGMARIAPVLAAAGCADFFVATVDEGAELRALLPNADITVFDGLRAFDPADFLAYRLMPALNDLREVAAWSEFAKQGGGKDGLNAALQLDTGMARLGLPEQQIERLAAEPERLAGINLQLVMSHLACADEPGHPANAKQLARFCAARDRLPRAAARVAASLANSSAIFLGTDYHFDMVRPGVAIYGLSPTPYALNPMRQVVSLQGKILQVRDVDRGQTVGYGATHRVSRSSRIATLAIGYADGYLRSLSNRGGGYVGDIQAPLVGRVSMDLITLDVTDIPVGRARPGDFVELIGAHRPVDELAADAGTIGYEILTRFGPRCRRVYTGHG